MRAMLHIIGLSVLVITGCQKLDDSLLGNTYDSQSDIEQQLSATYD